MKTLEVIKQSVVVLDEGFDGMACMISSEGNDYAIIASWGASWEHVSVHIKEAKRCPTWPEMCFIKSVFWTSDECVVQYHPPESSYVNTHSYCLHLWRPVVEQMLMPPMSFV